MAKKEIVNVDLYEDDASQNLFKDGFLVAIRNDTLQIKNDKLYMETPEKIYAVNLYHFAYVWQPSFEHIYGQDFNQLFQIDSLRPGMMRSLYEWTNPILDELPVKIVAKAKFLADLRNRISYDEKYRDTIKKAAYQEINGLDLDLGKKYMDRFVSLGVLDIKDKIALGYYADYTAEMMEKVFEKEGFSEQEKINVVSQAFALERRKQELSGKKSKNGYNGRIVQLVNLLAVEEILDVFMNKILTTEEFIRTKVTKKDLLALPYDDLLELLTKRNDVLPQQLKITSRDLLNEYGRNFTGNTICKLALYGYIEPQDFVEVFEINKALRTVSDEKDILGEGELRAFYTPSRIIGMKEHQLLTPKFLEIFLELQDYKNNPDYYNKQSKMLIAELKRKKEKDAKQIQDDILYFLDIGLCDIETTKENISQEDIESRFMNNELTMDQVLQYYQIGLIGDEAISKYYIDEEIVELYEAGQIKGNCLRAVKNVDLLLQRFCDGKIADYDFVMLYFSGNLSINDLTDGLQLAEKEVDIANLMDETVTYQQIKELFANYLIDYSAVLRLYHHGVINKKQLKEIENTVSTREFFQELESGRVYKVITSREGDTTPKGPVSVERKTEKDFSDEIGLISELLEKDIESENYSLIQSYNVKGRPTSLNQYRIFGNEQLDGIIILQKSKKENAVYVMSAWQMMYFLKGKENSDGQIEIQNRMKDKAYLKTIEGVEVIEHSEYFARNLVEAAAKISPKIAKKVKQKDGNYIEDVNKMVKDMREKYLGDREKSRND